MEDWSSYLTALVPLPGYVRGVSDPVKRLGTDWLVSPEGCCPERQQAGTGSIGTGEVDRRDAAESGDEAEELCLMGRISLPEDYAGHHVFLRFERAGCIAALYADGILIKKHYGSYTAWEAEIPESIVRNQPEIGGIEIRLVLKGDAGKLSPYQKAGIFGDIMLIALPEAYISELTADLDGHTARLSYRLGGAAQKHGLRTAFTVSDDYSGNKGVYGEEQKRQPSANNGKSCQKGEPSADSGKSCQKEVRSADSGKSCQKEVRSADSGKSGPKEEQPASSVFIHMEEQAQVSGGCVSLVCPEASLWSPEHPVLYRVEAELRDEDGLLMKTELPIGFRSLAIDGNQVFWNGQPVKLKGICYREPLILEGYSKDKDLELFKNAGINYIRALYYPFDEAMLKLCDEMGFYVEQMPAVSEVDQGIAPTQNAPEYRQAYLSQFGDVLAAGKSHVSLLLWLLGSESTWGANFRQVYRLAKAADPVRPVNFHYPMTVPEEETQPDIWSVYYASWNLKLDEHYDHMTIGHTHGSHNEIGYATGQAPDYTMPVLHDAFAHIACFNRDQIDRDPGIHEFWGESIVRFVKKMEHTKGTLGGAVMAAVDEDGSFDARLSGFRYGILDEKHQPKPEYYHLKMAYTGGATYEADPEEEAAAGQALLNSAEGCGGALPYRLEETKDEIRFVNNRFRFHFSRKTCLLCGAWADGTLIIQEGPFPQTTRFLLPEWTGDRLLTDVTPDGGSALIEGHFGNDLQARFELKFTKTGRLTAEFTPLKIGRPMPHTVKANIGVDPGGLDELGIAWVLSDSFDRLAFRRRGLWKEYPQEHIGRCEGTALRGNREDFESMKHSVIYAKAEDERGAGVLVVSDGSLSVRMQGEPAPELVIDDRDEGITYNGTWYRMDDYCGNYKGTETLSKTAGDTMEYEFEGTGIAVYGPVDINYGMCSVFLDGNPVKENISRYPEAADFPGMSRGYEKRYRLPIIRLTGLADTKHKIVLKVCGTKVPGAQETYASVDYLVVEKPGVSGNVRMILNNDYNYTRLVRGNYMRDMVTMREGCPIKHTLCLCAGGKAGV